MDPRELEVRPGAPDDVDAVVDCQTTCWREAYTGLVPQSYLDDPLVEQRRRARWTLNLTGGRSVWVAAGPAGIAGIATSGPSRDPAPEPPTELMSLYVRAAFHGTGVADRLIQAAIGSQPASLWMFAANPRAGAFYRRHGFRPDGEQKIDPDTGVPEIRLIRPAVRAAGPV